jgi:PncC family amidohydrolase
MSLQEEVGGLLREQGLNLSVAESCTGGLITHCLTNIPGSSDYVERSVVVYSNLSKTEMLKVPKELIEQCGAVSEEVAKAMAQGVRTMARTSLGLAVTGIAGPSGGSVSKPVGTVFIALAGEKELMCNGYHFRGSREEIKCMSSEKALEMLCDYLRGKTEGVKGSSENVKCQNPKSQ